MAQETTSTQPAQWLGLPVIATIARLLCRELTLQNEYLRLENKILRSKIEGRIHFTDDERLAGALLDRLTHHVHILEIIGNSNRLKSSLEKGTEKNE